jgi:tetratricopeptide (TPR) repeat protein
VLPTAAGGKARGIARVRSVFVLCLVCLVAATAQSPVAAEERPAGLVAAAAAGQDVELGRLLLAAGKPRQAGKLFLACWNDPARSAWSRGRLAFYLALCEDAAGSSSSAALWYRRADELSFAELCREDRAYFVALAAPRQPTSTIAASLWSLCLPTAMVAGGSDRLTGIVGQIRQSRRQYEAEGSIENRIRLASWLLLFAEMTAEDRDRGLWSRSVDAFTEGLGHLGEIQTAFDKDPKLEEQISKTPALAMRLDASRVRKAQVERRQQLSRQQELDRLNQLRKLVRSYRDLNQQMALAQFHFLLEGYPSARAANTKVVESLGTVFATAAERRDYYLFSDEPALEGDGDFQVVETPAEPISQNIVSSVKALHALIALRLATADPKAAQPELLAEAEAWSRAAIEGVQPAGLTLPPGQDEKNLLAHYVWGRAREASGVLRTAQEPTNPAAHAAAKKDFEEAKRHLARASELARAQAGPEGTLGLLAQDVEGRLASLGSDASFLAAAADLTRQGKPQEAWIALHEGIVRHATLPLWLARAESARRGQIDAKMILAELDGATASGILPGQDARVQLVRAKAVLAAAWRRMAQGGLAAGAVEQLRSELTRQHDALTKTVGLCGGDRPLQAEVQAFLALAIAYHTMLSERDPAQESQLSEGFRLARDAAAALEACLKSEQDFARQVALREALIASRLAQGYLAVRVLPSYRDETMLAFAAAFDEMAKLPFAQRDLKFLGSPIIDAVTNRPGEAGQKLALEERQHRQMVTRFVEGAFSLHLGNAAGAADQMGGALTASQQPQGKSGVKTLDEASQALAGADGFDARLTLPDTLRSFKVLADVAAGRSRAALLESLRMLVPEMLPADADERYVESAREDALVKAVGKAQSPLASFALGMALEGYAVSLGVEPTPRREMLLRQAVAAQARTAALLESLPTSSRYPYLLALQREAKSRLTAPESYCEEALKLRGKGDLAGACVKLEDGLKRHPRSGKLWDELLALQVAQVERQTSGPRNYDTLLERLRFAQGTGALPAYLVHYYQGCVYERMGKRSEAVAAYEQALAQATEPAVRVRARAKAAALKSTLAAQRT